MNISPKIKRSLKFMFGGTVFGLAVIGAEGIYNDLNTSPTPVMQNPAAEKILASNENGEMDAATAKVYRMLGIMAEIGETHVDEKKANDLDGIITAALKGISAHMDPHSDYLTADEFKAMMDQSSGEFTGVGANLALDEETKFAKVLGVIEDSPAEKAGIKMGDLITHIDGVSTYSMDLENSVKKIRGVTGTTVSLTILHKGTKEPTQITATRAKIQNLPVKSAKIGNVGYIQLRDFMYTKMANDEKTVVEDGATLVRDAILKLKTEAGSKIQGYVIDLRSNPGGELEQAVNIADHFLDAGKVVVTSDGRTPEANRVYKTEIAGDITDGAPIIILVNEGSASASELLSSALQDHGRVTVLGRQTFGKGSVQSVKTLTDGSALKITTALYHTPEGHGVQGVGVTPDILYVGKTLLDDNTRKESGMSNVLPDNAKANPHKTSATCGPASEDMSPETLTQSFNSKVVVDPDNKVDGMLLCAVETLQGQSKWTITQPYKMPVADAPMLTQ